MIAAERALLDSAHRASAIRFAGIYGYPGGRLLERIRRGELSPAQPVRYGNRIHRDDCAGFICHLLEQVAGGGSLAPAYNGVDDLPAAQFEVDSWLAAALGVRGEPALTPLSNAPEGMSTGHKRCSNRLLHSTGYRLLYPDYRSGYGALLGGAVIDAANPMADGRHGLESLLLRYWSFLDGSSQEMLDPYYLSITLSAQKMFADHAPEPIDRLMGRRD